MTPATPKVPRGEVRPDAPGVFVKVYRVVTPDGDTVQVVFYADADCAAWLVHGREVHVPRGLA